jgi:hypothetical protein
MHDPADLPGSEPNQLLAEGIPTAEGYSSLPSQRHVELDTSTSTDPRLIDVWSAPFVLEPPGPADLHEVNGVRFRAAHPLAAGFGGSSTQTFRLPTGIGPIVRVRVIGTLSYAYKAPQGETVATIGIGGQMMPFRAGIESSERAYDRPSLSGLVQHQKAAAAMRSAESIRWI